MTTASVQLENKITGRKSRGAGRQDELIGGKQSVVKLLWLWRLQWLLSYLYSRVERLEHETVHLPLSSNVDGVEGYLHLYASKSRFWGAEETTSIQQSMSGQAASPIYNQGFPTVLWKIKVRYSVLKDHPSPYLEQLAVLESRQNCLGCMVQSIPRPWSDTCFGGTWFLHLQDRSGWNEDIDGAYIT
jgi:hypothetical protein